MNESNSISLTTADELVLSQARIRELQLALESKTKEHRYLTERFQRLLGTLTDYVYTVRVENGHVLETRHSEGCLGVTGYSSQEFADDPMLWIQMVHPADREQVTNLGRLILAGNEVEPIEHRILHKNGSHRWVKNTPLVKHDATGNVTGYDGILCDVTEHKRQELLLQEAREKQQRAGTLVTTILSNTFMSAVYLDTEFNYLWVNDAYAKSCARPAAYFPGKNLFQLYPQFGARRSFEQVSLSGDPLFGAALPIDFPDQPERGTTFWDYSLYPIYDNVQTPVGLVLTLAEVTERIRMEEQIRKSEVRYRTIANHTYDWESWVTPDGRYAYCSPSCLRVTGHYPEEFLSRPDLLETLIFLDDLPFWQAHRKQDAAENAIREFDFRIRKPDGAIAWLSHRCAPIFSEERIHLGWRASTRDITDRKQSELQLRTQAELLELSPVCVTVHDEQGRFTYANQTAISLHGCTREQFLALSVPELRTAASASEFPAQMQLLRQGGQLSFKAMHQRRDGTVLTLLTIVQATLLDDKLMVLSVAADIADQEKANAALAKSESALRALFEAVDDMVVVVNLDETVAACNAMTGTRLGRTTSELIGRKIFDFIDEPAATRRRSHFEAVTLSGKSVHFEDELGSLILECSLYPIFGSDGKVAQIAIFARDTTERRHAETRLRRTNEHLISLREAQFQFMTSGNPRAVYQTLLSALVELSQSKLGYLARIDESIATQTLALVSPEGNVSEELFTESVADVLSHVREQKPTNGNATSAKPSVNGVADAAAANMDTVQTQLAIPLVYGGELVGVVGLSGCETGYTNAAIEMLAPFTSTCAATIHAVETTKLYREQGAMLRESEETKRAIIETMPGVVYRATIFPNARVLHVSSGITPITGYEAAEFLQAGFDWNALIVPEDIPQILDVIKHGQLEQKPFELDLRIREKRGKLRWIHAKAQFTRDTKGRVAFIDGVAIDVTERRLAEAALHAKTLELEGYFAGALDLLCIADTSGYFRRLNPAWTTALGYRIDELEGKRFLDLVHPDDVPATLEALRLLSCQKEVSSFTNRYRHHDGTYRHIEWRSSPAGDLVFAAARDVTDRITAERALRQSEARYRVLVENTPDIVTHFDASGRPLYVSPSLSSVTDFAATDLVGKTYIEAGLPAETARLWQARVDRVLTTLRPDEAEIDYESPRRGTVVLNWRLFPIRDADGNTTVLSIARDITEQKRLEREYQSLFTEMQSGLIVCEATRTPTDSTFSFTLAAVNPAFERLTGLVGETLLGKSLSNALPQTDRQWLDVFTQVMASGTPSHFEAQLSDIGRLFEITAFRSAPRQLACIFTDISERRRLQEQYHQSTKLEAIGRLASGVAHDLNNLLMPILGYSDAILETLPPSDRQLMPLMEIRSAGQQAKDLVRQLLAFGRKQQLEVHTIDLIATVSAFAKLLERALRENIGFNLVLSPGPLWVDADIGQLELMLMNLAVNAQDSMPQGGQLTIEVSPSNARDSLHTHAPRAREEVVLLVRDTGVGMDADTRERIFEPFFTTRGTGKTTGWGLAAIHGIVVQHGGTISVESERGKGTEFVIRLPVATLDDSGHVDTDAPVSQALPFGRERLIVVEDNPLVKDLAVRALENQGYRVRSAANAEECLATMSEQAQRFDLLVTDVVMPEMNGKALFAVLKARFPDLKVTYMSGYSREFVTQQHGLELECPFLQKPFSMRKLLATVRQVLDQKARARLPR